VVNKKVFFSRLPLLKIRAVLRKAVALILEYTHKFTDKCHFTNLSPADETVRATLQKNCDTFDF
jgi:hypothetical protein